MRFVKWNPTGPLLIIVVSAGLLICLHFSCWVPASSPETEMAKVIDCAHEVFKAYEAKAKATRPTTQPAESAEIILYDQDPLAGRLEVDLGDPLDVGKGKTAYMLRLINCELDYISTDFGDTCIRYYLLILDDPEK